jgi:hypothetical protein
MAKTDNSNLFQSGVTHVAEVVRSARKKMSPRAWIALSLVALLAGTVALMGAFHKQLKGTTVETVTATIQQAVAPSVDDLKAVVAKDPKNAAAQMALADALFDAGKKDAAMAGYDTALGLDPSLVSDRLAENLVSGFGTPQQATAYNVIVHRNVIAAEPALHKLAGDKRHAVRTGAVAALDKLGKASRDDWTVMWIADTREESCDLRRNAVEKLGEFGDRRALTAIRAANKKDDDQTRWYQLSCLRSRPQDAEKKILARR